VRAGRLTRSIGRQTRLDVLLGFGVEMKLQLGIERGLSRLSVPEAPEPVQ
jgi:hypothetical protein